MPDVHALKPRSPIPLGSVLSAALIAVMVIAALYFGREVLVPIALAMLMSFVLAPPVRALQSIYVPRTLAVIVVVLVAFGAVFGLAALMVSQVNELARELPSYQTTLRDKIQGLRGASAGTGTLERASEVLQDLSKELDKPTVTQRGRPNVSLKCDSLILAPFKHS
jgi:predicted PurR-regulated permease PerM